ncbi:MAG: rRNA (cytidine-2'-O-)-methyltransferase, partial [Dehalococcoidia bacterium]
AGAKLADAGALRSTLEDALSALGDRQIAVARELTKLYEEIWRGRISAALDHFLEPRGEFTLVIEGIEPEVRAPQEDISSGIAAMRDDGLSSKDAVAQIVERYGVSRRDAYRLWHQE